MKMMRKANRNVRRKWADCGCMATSVPGGFERRHGVRFCGETQSPWADWSIDVVRNMSPTVFTDCDLNARHREPIFDPRVLAALARRTMGPITRRGLLNALHAGGWKLGGVDGDVVDWEYGDYILTVCGKEDGVIVSGPKPWPSLPIEVSSFEEAWIASILCQLGDWPLWKGEAR